MKLRDIAALVDADVEGDGTLEIRGVAKIEEAGEGDITFLANPKYGRFLESTGASAVIVSRNLEPEPRDARGGPRRRSYLRVDDPYLAFLKVLQTMHPPAEILPPGIHPTAVIGSSALMGRGVRVGAHVVVGERCRIGDNTVLSHGVVVGNDVSIGDGTLLHAHVVVREGCRIGSRVIVHSGTVIGSDGFGFAPRKDGSYEKIPQMGIVVIEDDVEIGANCTIDRATMGETLIKKGAKLDNLIQVAHNAVVGEHTVIAAQAGISGSTKLGKGCMIGGQVGFVGHLSIADNTKIGAQSGVHRSIEKPGMTYFGYPAHPHREAFKMQAAVTQLPDLLVTVRRLQHELEELRKDLQAITSGSKNR